MINFEKFYSDNYEKKLILLGKIIPDTETCKDILQDAFTKMWVEQNKYNPKKGNLHTWFNSIMYNTMRDYQRKHKNAPEQSSVNVDDIEDADLRFVLENVPEVYKTLDDMKNKSHRSIIVARLVLGYSCEEVAHMNNTTVNNVTTICHRFREKIEAE